MAQPVLFLHGWTMRGAVFDDLAARLGPGFDCAAPDLPGHGASTALPPTLDACADVMAGALDQWHGRTTLVIGWSMGAAVAWRYIARFGTGRLAGLVTVDMSPKPAPAPGWPHGLTGQTAETIAGTTRRYAADWDGVTHGIATTMFATPQGAPGLTREQARQIILSHDPDKMCALWAELVATDARGVIPAIDVPYLVCSGARSRVYPAPASDWIAATAPDARHHVFRRSGHSPHLEEPEAFARVISDFANGLDA